MASPAPDIHSNAITAIDDSETAPLTTQPSTTRLPQLPPSPPRSLAIDSLRGYAALAVVYYHFTTHCGVPRPIWTTPFVDLHPSAILAESGVWAVPLFFLISAFVLSNPFVTGSRILTTRGDLLSYLSRRCGRIFPLYALAMLIAVTQPPYNLQAPDLYAVGVSQGLHKDPPMYPPQIDLSSSTSAANLGTMATFTFTGWQEPYYNLSMWSLGYEMVFSVLLPLILYILKHRPKSILFATIATFFLIRVLYVSIANPSPASFSLSTVGGGLEMFAYGLLVPHLPPPPRITRPLSLALLLLALSLLQSHTIAAPTSTPRNPLLYSVIPSELLYTSLTLLLHSLLHHPLSPPYSHLLLSPPTVLLGRAALSVYIHQENTIRALAISITRIQLSKCDTPPPYNSGIEPCTRCWGDVLVTMTLLLVLSAVSYRYVEFPGKEVGVLVGGCWARRESEGEDETRKVVEMQRRGEGHTHL